MDHRSLNRIAYTAATVLVSVLLIFTSLASISTAAPRPASPLTGKILIDSEDEATIEELVRLGATRLEDYGAFALWWVPQNRGKSLRGRAGVAAPDEFDVIYLRGGQVVDTDTDAPSVAGALRQTRTKGSQFWLVQFIGPIKGEWLDALRAMGLEIVMYMPNNAYVVWGDDDTLRSLEASVPKSPVIQWMCKHWRPTVT